MNMIRNSHGAVLVQAYAAHPGPTREPVRKNRTDAGKVLIIDDKKLVLQSVRRLLAQTGFELLSSEDSFTGLVELARQSPHTVLIDAGMNGLSGNQFCALVKASPGLQPVNMIVMLDQSDPLRQAKALAAGADSVLIKPFGKDELLNLIQEKRAKVT